MAETQKGYVVDEIVKGLSLNPAQAPIPKEVINSIQPVYVANPSILYSYKPFFTSGAITTTGTSTVKTTTTGRRTFLTMICLNNQSNATADNTLITFGAQLINQSASSTVLRLSKLTTTAFDKAITISFPYPIELAEGSAISFGSSFTVGASVTGCSVAGFEIEKDM